MARCLTEFVLSTTGVDDRHSLACTSRVLFWPTPTLTSKITSKTSKTTKKHPLFGSYTCPSVVTPSPSRLVPTPVPPRSEYCSAARLGIIHFLLLRLFVLLTSSEMRETTSMSSTLMTLISCATTSQNQHHCAQLQMKIWRY